MTSIYEEITYSLLLNWQNLEISFRLSISQATGFIGSRKNHPAGTKIFVTTEVDYFEIVRNTLDHSVSAVV